MAQTPSHLDGRTHAVGTQARPTGRAAPRDPAAAPHRREDLRREGALDAATNNGDGAEAAAALAVAHAALDRRAAKAGAIHPSTPRRRRKSRLTAEVQRRDRRGTRSRPRAASRSRRARPRRRRPHEAASPPGKADKAKGAQTAAEQGAHRALEDRPRRRRARRPTATTGTVETAATAGQVDDARRRPRPRRRRRRRLRRRNGDREEGPAPRRPRQEGREVSADTSPTDRRPGTAGAFRFADRIRKRRGALDRGALHRRRLAGLRPGESVGASPPIRAPASVRTISVSAVDACWAQ